jgi:hypothetical protein
MNMIVIEKLRRISPSDFAMLGMSDIAYVKRVEAEDRAVYEIHAADGTQVAVLEDQAVAVATIRQHDLEALSVH